MTHLDPRHVILAGPMGAGKTSVGERLALELGRPFHDSDRQLAELFGTTGRALALERGVEWLHEAEVAAFRSAIQEPEPAVIAAAASVADQAGLGELMGRSEAVVVVLLARPEVLESRCHPDDHRRPVDRQLYAAKSELRLQALSGIADLVVDTTSLSVDEVVNQILSILGGLAAPRGQC